MGLIRSIRRHWKRWTLGSIAGAAVVLVGVPFVYIHFIAGPAPAPFSLSKPHTTGADDARVVPVEGSWAVAEGSQAGYRVDETLAGQSLTTVGRTRAVRGTITISGTAVTTASFTVDLTKITSDEEGRDAVFQGPIMDTATYPTATFTLTRPIELKAPPPQGVQITRKVTGKLELHGVSRVVRFSVTAQRSATSLQITGAIPLTFADYGISAPNAGPANVVDDHGTIEFLLNFTPDEPVHQHTTVATPV